jgi:hypothetical protein
MGPALVASALAAAVVAWGVPPSFRPPPEPSHISWGFEPDTALAPGSRFEEIVRHIIRRHIDEVKWCYQQELSRQPELAGKILVQFTVAAVRRWQFPKPLGGGRMIINYPFVLTPPPINADAGAAAAKE